MRMVVVVVVALAGSASCADDAQTTAGGASSSSNSSSSAGTGASGLGGSGGVSSGAGGTEGGASAGGGGAEPGSTLVLLAVGQSDALGAHYQDGVWQTQPLQQATSHRIALAITDGTAVGVVRDKDSGVLRYTTWSDGTWAGFADIASGATTDLAPDAVAVGGEVLVVFHGEDDTHYFVSYDGAWGTVEPVSADGIDSIGPSEGTLTALGADTIFTYCPLDFEARVQIRSGGSWQPAVPITGSDVSQYPTITPLAVGPELLAVWPRNGTNQFYYALRDEGAWGPVQLLGPTGLQQPSLAGLSNGGALLTYRGLDSLGYWARYTTEWSAAAALPALVPSPPVVARGVGGAEADIAYISSGAVYHVRLIDGQLGEPVLVGGAGMVKLAIARE